MHVFRKLENSSLNLKYGRGTQVYTVIQVTYQRCCLHDVAVVHIPCMWQYAGTGVAGQCTSVSTQHQHVTRRHLRQVSQAARLTCNRQCYTVIIPYLFSAKVNNNGHRLLYVYSRLDRVNVSFTCNARAFPPFILSCTRSGVIWQDMIYLSLDL